MWNGAPERFRLHAVAVQRAADRIVREIDHPDRDELLVAALLHDVGKLVLEHAYPAYPSRRRPYPRRAARPGSRPGALVGGVVARRWKLPARLATAIERHHAEEATDDGAVIRLADMLAHYVNGGPIERASLLKGSTGGGVGAPQACLDPLRSADRRWERASPRRSLPLSGRELEILKQLAEGKVYVQIAADLNLSTSTVRTHLHNTYAKLGAPRPRAGGPARYAARLALAPSSPEGAPVHWRRMKTAASRAPVASMATSIGEPLRPATNVWWSSSVAA
jgi:DNA-binding CsgD family transcriptional regulator